MQKIRWITLGLVLGAGGGVGVAGLAAPGDAIYEAPTEWCDLTAQEAACFADCAIVAECWSGSRADMIRACAMRDPASETGFRGFTRGMKAAPLVDVPPGSTVHGVVVAE